MFEVLVLFISLTIAARVVDFPEPVGPTIAFTVPGFIFKLKDFKTFIFLS